MRQPLLNCILRVCLLVQSVSVAPIKFEFSSVQPNLMACRPDLYDLHSITVVEPV
jgi:hypothetical protein